MMIALTPRIPICRTAQYFNPHFRKGSDRAAAIYRMPGKYFNPHFRKGSDGVGTVVPLDANYFNPHFRKGSDYMGQRVQWWVWHFNPHFRKGSDQAYGADRGAVGNFNPHFRKGSDWFSDSRSAAHHYFNPHFRKGSDSYSHPHADFTNISIHTSAREVTSGWSCRPALWEFQSTLPQGKWRPYEYIRSGTDANFNPHFRKGSDYPVRNIPASPDNFNPHFRKGSDAVILHLHVCPTISIHTSAREVTSVQQGLRYHIQQFQSTLPQGKWLISFPSFPMIYIFQSTLPQGKWQIFDFLSQIVKYISIHTSAREVTRYPIQSSLKRTFQSTLPQGKWRLLAVDSGNLPWFQSTLPQGKWQTARRERQRLQSFQSTLPQGKWPCAVMAYVDTNDFNPHFRKGSDTSRWLLL